MSECAKCGNTNEWAGYIYGFCDACAKSILNAAAKRYQRKASASTPKTDKRLEQDIARANAALAALATCEQRLGLTGPECRFAIDSESRRMQRALTDHRLLWSIYRRSDKTTPYYESAASVPELAEPIRVTAELEPEMVAT